MSRACWLGMERLKYNLPLFHYDSSLIHIYKFLIIFMLWKTVRMGLIFKWQYTKLSVFTDHNMQPFVSLMI